MTRTGLGFLAALALALVTSHARVAHADATPLRTLGSEPAVTVFGASWCSACKALERDLHDRNVPFALIDVDQNARAYDAAKRATGKSVVPITSVAKSEDDVTWIVGADGEAVEKAYRDESK